MDDVGGEGERRRLNRSVPRPADLAHRLPRGVGSAARRASPLRDLRDLRHPSRRLRHDSQGASGSTGRAQGPGGGTSHTGWSQNGCRPRRQSRPSLLGLHMYSRASRAHRSSVLREPFQRSDRHRHPRTLGPQEPTPSRRATQVAPALARICANIGRVVPTSTHSWYGSRRQRDATRASGGQMDGTGPNT